MLHPPKLLLPADYVKDATKAITHAKKHVSFLCMLVTDDEATDGLIDALCDAAKRGVKVDVAADVFTYGELSGHFIPTSYYGKKARATTMMTRQFEESGVNFNWLGRFANTPITGRTHIKWCVVDDIIYSFGGVNLYDLGIKNSDYMFKVVDRTLAFTLSEEYGRLVRADNGHFAYRSRSIQSNIGTVHIDGGLPLDSVIYRRACALTKEATSVLFVSQYCATGKLSRLLKRTNSKLYFNTGKQATLINRVIIDLSSFFTANKTLYRRKNYLHAKFMIFDMPDGKRIALTGSHNFVHGGVLLGTREVALETSNKKIIDQLEKFYRDFV
ncbi:MAG: phospholipase D-like domain-containing protein, partial [Candidatus Saccharibacteria bacterium]